MDLADKVFFAYVVRGKLFSCEVEKLITYFVMTCDDETSVSASQSMTYRKLLRTTIAFLLKVGGGGRVNIVIYTQKVTIFHGQ